MDLFLNYINSNLDLIITTFITLSVSVINGGLIGLERTTAGSPAGFRTHILVCIASTLLTMLPAHHLSILPSIPLDTIRLDPTRMITGVITGILTGMGFLGAGVIIKTGPNVRGLTSAATLWITGAIGILIGMDFYIGATLGTITILSILVIFRWVEKVIPTHNFAKLKVVVESMNPVIEEQLNSILNECEINVLKTSYGYNKEKCEFRITIRTPNLKSNTKLAHMLSESSFVKSFDIRAIRT